MATITAPNAAAKFDWQRWPRTEEFIDNLIARGIERNSFAAGLAERLGPETGTSLKVWVDHLVVEGSAELPKTLTELGYHRSLATHPSGGIVHAHAGGIFPQVIARLTTSDATDEQGVSAVTAIGIKVESVALFSMAHDLGLEINGYAMGPFRSAVVPGQGTNLVVVERRAYQGFEPYPGELAQEGRMKPHAARDALAARDLWRARKRRFNDDGEGFDVTDATLERVIELAGSRDLACHLVFEVEREYWEARNKAARVQKARQDRLGLGWANHDHHTFRSSRRYFPRLIAIFTRLGFQLRESFHAGEHAGWGAQVLEHPTTGIVIFADLDLAPEEANQDFAHQAMADLGRPGTVGLWVALHGESILEAGMHHLEAQFEFDALRDGLKAEANIETMKPFSDFPFLRQAFTAGERWKVSPARLDRALKLGWIDEAQRTKFLNEGAIGSHLENLQRREGYKGFNQHAVSAIIAATDPRLH